MNTEYRFEHFYPGKFEAFQKDQSLRLDSYLDFVFNNTAAIRRFVDDGENGFRAGVNLKRLVANNWAYHGVIHILSIFQFHRDFVVREQGGFKLDDEQKLGLWFHDSVYDPRKSGTGVNEQESVQFMNMLLKNHVPEPHLQKAADYILVTAEFNNKGPVDEKDAQILDLDLCYFASHPDHFRQGADALASEYNGIYTPEEFRKGRNDFLQGLLNRGFIYRTPFFKRRFEAHAVDNIKSAIEWK
jgi:predicted metal-dependent HD superfamily phosphohydrolase